jgi:hypothetical protein
MNISINIDRYINMIMTINMNMNMNEQEQVHETGK